MNGRLPSLRHGRALVASFVVAAFGLTIALAASPDLHARIHPDANKTEHTCATTLIASGSYHYSAPPPLVSPVAAPVRLPFVESLPRQWVGSIFLGASIFEHAPPVSA